MGGGWPDHDGWSQNLPPEKRHSGVYSQDDDRADPGVSGVRDDDREELREVKRRLTAIESRLNRWSGGFVAFLTGSSGFAFLLANWEKIKGLFK